MAQYPSDPYSRSPYGDRYYGQPPPGHYPLWPWLVLLLVIGVLAAWRFWPRTEETGTNLNAAPRAVTARGSLAEEEKTTIKIFREASPSVVQVTTLGLQQNASTLQVQRVPEGLGSGIVWDADGHIVTNYHVVQNVVEREAGAAKVTLADQSTWDVRWIRAYPSQDLAVLWIKAPASRLHPIMVGTSHDLQVGQATFAIGNPYGLDHTMTKGIVSALNREMASVAQTPIKGVIQTDAAINPGNSGGPLLDSAGRLIGVNTAIRSASGSSAGIGFAIPVDEVNRIVTQLIRHGRVVHPELGVQLEDDQLTRRLGLEGVLVRTVQPGSPAARAAIQPRGRKTNGHIQFGDLIVAINGQPVESTSDFYELMDKFNEGDEITVTVVRDDEKKDIKVTLVQKPPA